jgi:hypothetical protein
LRKIICSINVWQLLHSKNLEWVFKCRCLCLLFLFEEGLTA